MRAVRRRRLAHVLVIATLAILARAFLEPERLISALRSVDLSTVLVLVAVAVADRLLMGAKWYQLLVAGGVSVRPTAVIGAYFKASFVNRIIPTSLGGDVVRAVSLGHGQDRSRIVASMVMEKAIGIIGALLLAMISAALLAPRLAEGDADLLLPALGMLAVAAVVTLIASMSDRVARALFRPFAGLARRTALGDLLRRLHTAYRGYRNRPDSLLLHLVLTLAEQLVQMSVMLLCARAVGIATPAVLLVPVLLLSELVRKLALVLEGWGLGELTRVLILGLAAVDANSAVALVILYHAVAWIAALPGGIIFLRHRRRRDLESASAPGVLGSSATS